MAEAGWGFMLAWGAKRGRRILFGKRLERNITSLVTVLSRVCSQTYSYIWTFVCLSNVLFKIKIASYFRIFHFS